MSLAFIYFSQHKGGQMSLWKNRQNVAIICQNQYICNFGRWKWFVKKLDYFYIKKTSLRKTSPNRRKFAPRVTGFYNIFIVFSNLEFFLLDSFWEVQNVVTKICQKMIDFPLRSFFRRYWANLGGPNGPINRNDVDGALKKLPT
jgi:hypothetical protein